MAVCHLAQLSAGYTGRAACGFMWRQTWELKDCLSTSIYRPASVAPFLPGKFGLKQGVICVGH